MKNVYIYTDGCECRLLDSKKISEYFRLNKYHIVKNPKDAEIIIYITCSFTDKAAEIFVNTIKEFKKYNAEIIVGGCIPLIDKKILQENFEGKTFTTKNINDIDRLFPDNKIKFKDIDDANILNKNIDDKKLLGVATQFINKSKILQKIAFKLKEIFLKNFFGEDSFILDTYYITYSKKPLFNIRISRGCLGNCTYCVIKNAIGTHKSKPVEECIKEFKKGLSNGYKQFVINADDTGAYGIDINSTLPELLKQMIKLPGDYYIAIRNLHPGWVVKYIDELEKIFATGRILSLDVQIQSSSNRILKLMNRYSDIKKIEAAILRIKRISLDIKINTNFIAGFPTETEDEFRKTINFLIKMELNGYVISFSLKKGSKANDINPKISKLEKQKRMDYAKKTLKKAGYTSFYTKRARMLLFEKKKKQGKIK